jgi:colicin import membrane protein
MSERKSDRWISVTQSVLLHAAVIGALAYGWYAYKQRPKPPAPTLAVEGVLVESKDLKSVPAKVEQPAPSPPPEPEKPPEPVEDVGPPTPTPEETQQREQAEREAVGAQQRLEEQHRAEEERQAQERKVAEEKEQKARQESEQKKREQEQREAEQKRVADAKKRAEEKRKADEARLATERQAELRKSLEQEERAMAMRSSGAMQNWIAQITNRIQRAWLRPSSAKPGIECTVYVTQVPGGEVTNVRVGTCNGDAAVRESIESAVLRASPLPPPPDPAMFERNLEIRFAPTD